MKNKLMKTCLFLSFSLLLCGCGSKNVSPTRQASTEVATEISTELPTVQNTDVKSDISGLLQTNISVVDNVSHENPGQNVMISGMSLNYALAMLSNGASPAATQELEHFLGMSVEEANELYGGYLNRKALSPENKLIISNSFWIKNDLEYEVRESFTSILKSIYKADVAKIPMDAEGIKQINEWAAFATDGMIKKALSPNDITRDTVSILINSILMDGKWATPFAAEDTHDVTFTLTDGTTTTVSGMHGEEYIYYENEHATAFRKDYKNREFYMVGILPKAEGEFDLSDLDIKGLLDSKKSTVEMNAELHIMLPRVDFETKYELSNVLRSMGLGQIFDVTSNNFSGVYDNDDPLFTSWASKIIQNDRLIIDETGTKAAAVTSIIMDTCTSLPVEKQQLYVYLNRPFVVLIMDGATDEPLFIAKIVHF